MAVDGALARKFEFGEDAISVGASSRLRLAPASRMLRGPDKYKVLEHRRHQAQIKARRLLELADDAEPSCELTDSGGEPGLAALATSGEFESMRGLS
jgi:hypothetical protein